MLYAEPHSAISWDFTVYDDGVSVAEIDLAWVRERAVVTIKEVDCDVYREGVGGAFVLAVDGYVLMRAEKTGVFSSAFDITYDEQAFHLKKRSVFSRAYDLFQADNVVGTITPRGVFTRRMDADLPEDLPLAVRVFILWLVIVLWKRAASAS